MYELINVKIDSLVETLTKIINFFEVNNLINSSTLKRFTNIRDIYKQLISTNFDVLNYDFKIVKRETLSLIHPDAVNANLKAESEQLAQEVTGILDDIIKTQKKIKDSSNEFYEEKTEETTQNKKRDSSAYKSVNEEQDLTEGIKSLWNYLFHNVPRNANDYYVLKDQYEKIINKIIFKIENKNKSVEHLKIELENLKREWYEAVSKKNINNIFNKNYNFLVKKHDVILQKIRNEEKFLNHIKDLSKQEINLKVEKKCEEMQNLLEQYNKTLEFLHYNPNFANKRYPGLKKSYNEFVKDSRENLQKFPNRSAIRVHISDEVYNSYTEYAPSIKKIRQLENEIKEVEDMLNVYKNKPNEVIQEISTNKNLEYETKNKKLSKRKSAIIHKQSKLNKKLNMIKLKYDEFLDNYQNLYEDQNKKETKR